MNSIVNRGCERGERIQPYKGNQLGFLFKELTNQASGIFNVRIPPIMMKIEQVAGREVSAN